ncbi:uncharacterized protein T551_03691 [Pneumocystis jirovecii RU7]|uniref:Uncharacterized protein n=1 Tax=Pneumocystis jirovecii (strain RU7) TaxID=1408657 RepID=A0A0W4ZAR2_PNEJ7|nr:uncharacterized protein T551_03691 [Pneumocystis jirovecii RU7]KTW25544.1 hypothetical protein T551_03691 [Pneumocystis jirovecii RU7]
MKAFIFSTLFCTIPVFSRSFGNIFNDDLDSRLLGPLSDGLLSALFVFHDGKDCLFLDGLCTELHKGYGNLSNLDSRLSDICHPKLDSATHCKNLLETAAPEARQLYTEIQGSGFSLGSCRHLLTLCNFLAGVYPPLGPLCEQLKLNCYHGAREHTALKALLHMGGDRLRTHDECVNKMEQVCHEYSDYTPEFKDLCVDLQSLCQTLMEGFVSTCEFLETQQTLNTKELSKTMCGLTDLCFDYGRNCNHQTRSFCKRLHSSCESKGYPVAPALGSSYETTPKKDLEEALTKYGVYMGRPDPNKKNPWDPSLCLLLQHSKQSPTKQACEHVTWDFVPLLGDPTLFPFCTPEESRLADKICLGLELRLKGDSGYLHNLQEKLSSMDLIGSPREIPKKYLEDGLELGDLLGMSSYSFTTHECTQLQADCYYYGIFGGKDLQRGCDRLFSKCYDKSWNKAVLKNLLGTADQRISGTTGLSSSSCQKHLAEKCKGLKYPDVPTILVCLQLGNTCEAYTEDLWEDI